MISFGVPSSKVVVATRETIWELWWIIGGRRQVKSLGVNSEQIVEEDLKKAPGGGWYSLHMPSVHILVSQESMEKHGV
jgi:hypothetical protein